MTPAMMILAIVSQMAPVGIDLIQRLTQLWTKPELTVDEFNSIMLLLPKKDLSKYLAEAGAVSRPTV